MNRVMRILVVAVLSASLSGCASVLVEGPAGTPITLVTTGKPTPNSRSFKVWYMFWGMMPLGDTSTAQMIHETGFKNVRVEVKMGIDDFLLSLLGAVPLIPVSRTVEIQGD